MVSWEPDPADVKNVIPQRLNGEPFGPETTPTEDQVLGIIGEVVGEVVGEVGSFDPTHVINPDAPAADRITLADLARRAVALGAASQIEDSFFPEQQTAGAYGETADGGNQHLYARYRRQLELLRNSIRTANESVTHYSGSITTPLTTRVSAARHPDTVG